ncbi:23S rRNA pseudouridine2604 synthase [Actimicrobium sp. GrIS 1.19]|uniref:rRNA pseudouridine synthase n=1 Tax=Actimicrobium sp. GrIS 1.19 TaxID=3071708 RepID=UPI002DF89F78|nr:23S rRNA pseudouridine2604 synthase [Actimicrobium sp. GrIS 1.19]
MTETIRLAKRVAEQLGCSRSEAEQYIEGGWILVDGVLTEESGARVTQAQVVELVPNAVLTPIEPVTLLLHKPAGMVTAEALDPEMHWIAEATKAPGDRSGHRFLRRHARNLTLTNPLEDSASGLLVLTQDWRVVRKLVDDGSRIEQEFVVEVRGTLAPDGLALLQEGLKWNGKPMPAIKVSWQSEHRLRFALKAPQRGMIAHLCEQVGLQVVSMKRIRIGRISMASLPVGQWRYLLGYEAF